jgi:hypothetical protein
MLAMPHHVSLSESRIVVGGSFACAVFLTIASSLAQVALVGASEIVLASPGEILAAGARDFLGHLFTLPGARVGAFSVITASAPPPDVAATCICTILSPPLSILIAPGAGAFHLYCSPPHFGSAFTSSNAGRYSDDRDVLRFAMFFCVITTVSILSSYCSIQRLLFILAPITAAFVIIPVISTARSFESLVSVRALEPFFTHKGIATIANSHFRHSWPNSQSIAQNVFIVDSRTLVNAPSSGVDGAGETKEARLLGKLYLARFCAIDLLLSFKARLSSIHLRNVAPCHFLTLFLILLSVMCIVFARRRFVRYLRYIWTTPKMNIMQDWRVFLVIASIFCMSPLSVQGQSHSCAILRSGAVKCWGEYPSGQVRLVV